MTFSKPQKAKHLHLDEALKNPKHRGHVYAIMEKFDGWFMYIDCIDGEWQGIRSKTGRVLPSMAKYSKLFSECRAPAIDIRMIFEATIDGMIFKDLNGKFNQKQVALSDVRLHAHDLLLPGHTITPFHSRYSDLHTIVATCRMPFVDIVPVLEYSSEKSVWLKHYNNVLSKPNGEGIILKRRSSYYSPNKRNHDLMKMKCEVTLDLLVVDVERGEGKYAHTLGKLVVVDAEGIKNSVSGMTDIQRDIWWAAPGIIKGAVVEVQAMKVLDNNSLREGRFKAIRFDKEEDSIDLLSNYK